MNWTCFLYKVHCFNAAWQQSDPPASQKKVTQWIRQAENFLRYLIKTTFFELLLADDANNSPMA